MKFQTTNGHEVEVDECDREMVESFTWHAIKSDETFYAVSSSSLYGEKNGQRLHRLIMRATEIELVDHIDGNGLNCHRNNLRLCSKEQNAKNRGKHKGKHRFKGVWPNSDGTWAAIIRGKRIGKYATDEWAALAYDRAAEREFGKFARLNFPDRKDEPPGLSFTPRGAYGSTKWREKRSGQMIIALVA